MSVNGPMIIVDDDHDDWDIFKMMLGDIGVTNELLFFDRTHDALDFLLTTTAKPFIIFCDVNMPEINGLEFRQHINENEILRKKCIPFIFMSTSAAFSSVQLAYDLSVQGFFEKAKTMDEIKSMLKLIIDYWKLCRHPNS